MAFSAEFVRVYDCCMSSFFPHLALFPPLLHCSSLPHTIPNPSYDDQKSSQSDTPTSLSRPTQSTQPSAFPTTTASSKSATTRTASFRPHWRTACSHSSISSCLMSRMWTRISSRRMDCSMARFGMLIIGMSCRAFLKREVGLG